MKARLNIIYILFLVFFSSCDNEQLKFEAPIVNILITKKINNNTGYIKYQVKKGYGANIKELYAEFYDITDTTSKVIRQSLQIRDSTLFVDSALINNLINKHDYRVDIKIITAKNEFTSNVQLLSLSAGYDETFTGILGCDLYSSDYEYMYMESNNGFDIKPMYKGQYFIVHIFYDDIFIKGNDYQFKLNGSIPLIPDKSYTTYSDYVSWGTKLPEGIPAGVYTLDLYVNNKKITAYTKIRILPGTYSESNLPAMPITLYPSWSSTEFILNNKIYFVYRYTTAYYNIANNSWVRTNDIKSNEANIGVTATQATFNYNGVQYLFVYYYKEMVQAPGTIKLLKYNEVNDSWEIITNVPDIYDDVFAFRSGDCVYLGYKKSDNKRFWEYNLKDNKWTSKKNIPAEMNGFITSTCDNGSTGYCMTSFRELWQYNASADEWQKISSLFAGPYSRYASKLVFDNNYIYALGGYTDTDYGHQDLNDFYRYNLNSQSWEYIYLCQYTYNGSASKFFHNNKIILLPCSGYNTYCKAEVTF